MDTDACRARAMELPRMHSQARARMKRAEENHDVSIVRCRAQRYQEAARSSLCRGIGGQSDGQPFAPTHPAGGQQDDAAISCFPHAVRSNALGRRQETAQAGTTVRRGSHALPQDHVEGQRQANRSRNEEDTDTSATGVLEHGLDGRRGATTTRVHTVRQDDTKDQDSAINDCRRSHQV